VEAIPAVGTDPSSRHEWGSNGDGARVIPGLKRFRLTLWFPSSS
jgi:hypothetical protein